MTTTLKDLISPCPICNKKMDHNEIKDHLLRCKKPVNPNSYLPIRYLTPKRQTISNTKPESFFSPQKLIVKKQSSKNTDKRNKVRVSQARESKPISEPAVKVVAKADVTFAKAPVQFRDKFCTQCGNLYKEKDRFCGNCANVRS